MCVDFMNVVQQQVLQAKQHLLQDGTHLLQVNEPAHLRLNSPVIQQYDDV